MRYLGCFPQAPNPGPLPFQTEWYGVVSKLAFDQGSYPTPRNTPSFFNHFQIFHCEYLPKSSDTHDVPIDIKLEKYFIHF